MYNFLPFLYDALLTTMVFIFVIMVIVTIHELGHYLAARLFNVKIEEFAIGFGKKLCSMVDRNGTMWSIRILPLGGYVKMFGDSDPASLTHDPRLDSLEEEEESLAFYCKPIWQKAIIVFAGPLANFLLAMFIFAASFFFYGQLKTSNEVTEVVENSPAYHAGIMPGDRIISIDEYEVDDIQDLKMKLSLNVGEIVTLEILREGKVYSTKLLPEMKELKDDVGNIIKVPVIGILSGKFEHVSCGLADSIWLGVSHTYRITVSMIEGLAQLVTGKRATAELGGPLTIAKYSRTHAESGGWYGIVLFIALLSINLGLVNLLPIPVLDGGHLMFYMLELLCGKHITEKIMYYSMKLGVLVLVMLMFMAFYNDIRKYIL